MDFKPHTTVEKIALIKAQFMRMWDTCKTGNDRKAVRMAALQSEFIRVFVDVDPIEILEPAVDKWIKEQVFMPTVAEFNEMLDAGYSDWVGQDYLDKRAGVGTRQVEPWDDFTLTVDQFKEATNCEDS